MLNSFKYFKYTRKISYNVFNYPKVIFIALNNRFKKRWIGLIKPMKTQTSLFWISKYYANYRKQKTSNFICFFKRKRKKNHATMYQSLDFCLYKAHFFKTIRQSRFFIKNKIVQVNSYTVNSPNYVLQEGDIVTLNWFFFSTMKNTLSNFFFFQFINNTKFLFFLIFFLK